MLDTLRTIFQSTIKALEILYVLEGIKPAARIMVNEDKKGQIANFLKENNLYYTISNFKIKKADNEKDYSDKGIKVPADSSEIGYYFFYISKSKEKTEEARLLEDKNEHKNLGILLGYPECCSEFFERNFPIESKKQNDYTLASLKNSDGFQFPFYTNIASRHFDVSLLSHFPCSFNCNDSIELAKKYLELIRKYDKKLADIIEGMSKGAVLYTETKGVFLLRYPELEHNRLFYKAVMASKNNELYELLKNAEFIEIINKNMIILDSFEIKNIGIMVFS